MSQNEKVNLTRFSKDLSRSLSRQGKQLLESPNLAQEVSKLAPLETYFIVKELGIEDATPILLNASRTQIQTIIDLDCWTGDKPDPLDLDAWLAPYAALGKEALRLAFFTLDTELQVVFLAESFDIFEYDPEASIHGSGRTIASKITPDNLFFLERRKPNDEPEVDPFFLIDAIYLNNLESPHRLLMAAKWESRGLLEEQAYQFRTGRMEDLGFPPLAEAVRIFAAPPKKAPGVHVSKWTSQIQTLPAIYARPLAGDSLFAAALSKIENTKLLSTLESDLINLTNSAIVAYGESPKNFSHSQLIAARVVDTLNLGLECLVAADESFTWPEHEQLASHGAIALEQWPLQDIFRHGYQAVQSLRQDAHRLIQDPVIKTWLDQAHTADDYSQDRLDREFLDALCAMRPLYAGFDPLKPKDARAFRCKKEIRTASNRIDQIRDRIG